MPRRRLLRDRQTELDTSPTTKSTFGGNAATVGTHRRAANHQAQPRATIIAPSQATAKEFLEDLLALGLRDACALVSHLNHDLALGRPSRDVQRSVLRRIAQGVLDEIDQN